MNCSKKIHMYIFAHCECKLLIKVTVNISYIDKRLKTLRTPRYYFVNEYIIRASEKYSKENALQNKKRIL